MEILKRQTTAESRDFSLSLPVRTKDIILNQYYQLKYKRYGNNSF